MDEFLERMRKSGNVYLSCAAAGIPRRTAYRWRDKWATFAEKWDEAKDDAVDKLDAEAWKRATDGASDRLLMFLLKAHKPEVYSPVQRLKHEGTGEDGAIIVEERYTDDQRNRGLAAFAGCLADALRARESASDSGPGVAVDAAERAAVAGVSESGG